jgi:hypothetical protein
MLSTEKAIQWAFGCADAHFDTTLWIAATSFRGYLDLTRYLSAFPD